MVPFLVQMGLFVSPIAFTSAALPARWRTIYSLNPVVGLIDGFRWCILGSGHPLPWKRFAVSGVLTLASLAFGVY